MMMKHYAVNTEVEWEWGNGSATGNIREKFTSDVERTIKGSSVKREAAIVIQPTLLNKTMAVRF